MPISASEPASIGSTHLPYGPTPVPGLADEFAKLVALGALEPLAETERSDGFWLWDLERPEACFFSADLLKALGYDPHERAQSVLDIGTIAFVEDAERVRANVVSRTESHDPINAQMMRCMEKNGTMRLVRCLAYAIRSEGVPIRILGSMRLVPCATGDELTSRLSDILTLSREAIIVWSAHCGVRRWSSGAESLYGITEAAVKGKAHFPTLKPRFPIDWERIEARVRNGETWSGEVSWTRPDGTVIVTETQLQRFSIRCGETLFLQIDHDITPQVRLAERQHILTRELRHRVKNLFAVIRSLVRLSASGQDDVPALVRDLDNRIAALAAAHVVSLGYQTNDGAPLQEVLQAVLGPYPASGEALRLDGPSVWVPQEKITPLGLILNELATNALKYGGWASHSGHVEVAWTLTRDDGPDGPTRITLSWREENPDFKPPAEVAVGFGTRLLQMSSAQLGAEVVRTWHPSGLLCTFTFDISAPSET
ncbi:PAS domain-containing protein [Acuticoccus sp. M5D2P5]|uniref:sensor histidine kinase n=1 Tax=Acuticoccus kalidii TaxID=2910977 RepID=UPI001F3EFDB4|nr:HWE histidine kinase domain-containing protein [Acuticoccus kalidii]MCF3932643.1 PAS domain-containing protein [Acuticoccus kalidii]